MAKAAKIGNRIRRLRFDNDEMTQEELANQAGCTRQTIIALEQGKYVPSITLAFQIAIAFGVTLEEVFQYEDRNI
ncbi:helix-turn-helix transcriptional regulator [Chloroflexota bacterium]